MRHCEPGAGPRRVGSVPAVHGKEVELARTDLVEPFQPVGRRPADDAGAAPTPADDSAAASLPTGWGHQPAALSMARRAWGRR